MQIPEPPPLPPANKTVLAKSLPRELGAVSTPVSFPCPACGGLIGYKASWSAGKNVKCPRCKARLKMKYAGTGLPLQPILANASVASVPAQTVVNCPDCQTPLLVDAEDARLGRRTRCSKCGARFAVTAADSPTAQKTANASLFDFSEPTHHTNESSASSSQAEPISNRWPSPLVPTALAIVSLLSVFWLWLPACLFSGSSIHPQRPRSNSPEAWEAYEHLSRSQNDLNQELSVWKTDSSTLLGGCYCFSLTVTLVLVVTSFFCWRWHNVPSRLITVLAAVLIVPITCCGLML